MATKKDNGVDPLRTFELSQGEWDEVVQSVVKEGREEWEPYVSSIVAAIQLGYLDPHLHLLGKFLRERYLHIRDGQPAPMYYATGVQPVSAPAVGVASVPGRSGLEMIPTGGVKPLRPALEGERNSAFCFVAKKHLFSKSDFVGKHFQSKAFSGSLVRIDKVNPQNFLTTIIECPNQPKNVGRSANFTIEKLFHIYDLT